MTATGTERLSSIMTACSNIQERSPDELNAISILEALTEADCVLREAIAELERTSAK